MSNIRDHAHLWKSDALEGVFLFKAQFHRFVFSKHSHDDFAVGVIEQGVQKFQNRGQIHIAPSEAIITVNPDEVHDGESVTDYGYQYRLAYISPDLISEILSEFHGSEISHIYFKNPVTFDNQLSKELLSSLLLLEQDQNNLLESQTRFIQAIASLFMRYGVHSQSPPDITKNRDIISKACDYIRTNALDNISLEDIAKEFGLSRFHFLRLFKSTTGFPPHAYLIQRRIELAKKAIKKGISLADAAIQSGFSDQSHLTRQFKAANGITPGQYQKAFHLKK